MRRRFVIRSAALDIAALAVSSLVASLLVFEHLLPWREDLADGLPTSNLQLPTS